MDVFDFLLLLGLPPGVIVLALMGVYFIRKNERDHTEMMQAIQHMQDEAKKDRRRIWKKMDKEFKRVYDHIDDVRSNT